ncbi:MAG: nucleoside 2-deoxyribosyltransferase [Firmicutes bacterium]|nr:nucleoside 2-deoxyribosyltransferase [Bacillota bacterium]
MKFYIASKLENAARVALLAKVLKSMGWQHTYDWTTHGSVKDQGEQRLQEVAENEIKGVAVADIVIVVLPGGRGTHAELGAAIALKKTIVIWAETEAHFEQDDRTCAFYWNTCITRVVGDALALMEELLLYVKL